MKKVIALISMIALLFTSSACADLGVFSIRNGISFEDTIDDVILKETALLKTVTDASSVDPQTPYHIYSEKSTFANIPESKIWYKFSPAKELREVVYSFRVDSKSNSVVDSDYLSINSGLREKYGLPLGNTNGKTHALRGYCLPKAFDQVALTKALGRSAQVLAYDEWLIEQERYYVKIEQVEYASLGYFMHEVSYTYFSKEKVDQDITNMINDL